MKKYSDANSEDAMGMLLDYTSHLTKYAEMMDKLDAIDTDDLSPADYAYYVDVTARIQKKLLEVSQ